MTQKKQFKSPSVKKRIRQTEKRTLINKSRLSRIRTFIRKLRDAVNAGESAEVLNSAFKCAESEIQRGANKGVMHKNKASRIVSRLSSFVKRHKEDKKAA